MLRLPPFSYRRAGSLEEAVKVLSGEGDSARLVAGGTDLWPNMKRRHQHAETVVSLMGIPGLSGIQPGANGDDLRIGATTRLSTVSSDMAVRERYPALSRAIASISSPPLRNMGTLGGNLCLDTRCTYYNQTEGWRRSIDYCMKENGQICWVAPSSPKCWAHSASDSAPILCALKARARLVSNDGDRVIAVQDLFRNDGIDYLNKRPDEILADILLPRSSDSSRCRSSFWKLRRRGTIDFAVLTVAAAIWFDEAERVEDAVVFLGSVGSQPLLVPEVANMLQGARLDSETIGDVATAARKVATPMDNTDFNTQWRGVMTARYTEAALREIAGLDSQLSPPRHQMLF
jgi:4-hydroxybenzoyl-CoA reductase subunit beta